MGGGGLGVVPLFFPILKSQLKLKVQIISNSRYYITCNDINFVCRRAKQTIYTLKIPITIRGSISEHMVKCTA